MEVFHGEFGRIRAEADHVMEKSRSERTPSKLMAVYL